jgi:hypothetical protein
VDESRIMKTLLIIAITAVLLAGVGAQNQDNLAGYRGIVPLKSNRSDVEHLLGRPTDPHNPTYYFSETIVAIQYSKYGCSPPPRVEGWPVPPVEGWNVPPDTVLAVHVTLRKQVTLESLKLDIKRFAKERGDSDVSSHFRYVDRKKGLTIDLNGDPKAEIVRAFIYEPEAKYTDLRCSEAK